MDGYESNDELSYGMGNGSAQLWKQVMREIHGDLEDKPSTAAPA